MSSTTNGVPLKNGKTKKKQQKLSAAQKFQMRLKKSRRRGKFYEHDYRGPRKSPEPMPIPDLKSSVAPQNSGGTRKIKHYWQRIKLLKRQQALMQKLIAGYYCHCACGSQPSVEPSQECQFYKIPANMRIRSEFVSSFL